MKGEIEEESWRLVGWVAGSVMLTHSSETNDLDGDQLFRARQNHIHEKAVM
jgi:hypothetical protein